MNKKEVRKDLARLTSALPVGELAVCMVRLVEQMDKPDCQKRREALYVA